MRIPFYRIAVFGDSESGRFLSPRLHTWEGSGARLVASPPAFLYLIYGGRYRLGFSLCSTRVGCISEEEEEEGALVYSDYVNLQPEATPLCDPPELEGGNSSAASVLVNPPTVRGMRAAFRFAFSPCAPLLPYDEANVTLHSSVSREECGTGSTTVLEDRRPLEESSAGGHVVVVYQTPDLEVRKTECRTVQCTGTLLTWVTCGDVSIRPSRPIAETVGARPPLAVPIPSPSGSSIATVGCSGEFCITS